MLTQARTAFARFEDALAGPLGPDVRTNIHIELSAWLAYGPFQAGLLFMPIILQRLGGTSTLIAWYQAASYVGFALLPFTARFTPSRNLPHFLGTVWGIGRALFALAAFAAGAPALFLVAFVFFLFDAFPAPAYTRVIQHIYPASVRGRVLGYVRLGLSLGMLLFTPVCGWLLDAFGHRLLLPVCAVFGVTSAWLFARLRIPGEPPDAKRTRSAPPLTSRSSSGAGGAGGTGLWHILRTDGRFRIFLLGVIFFGFAGLIPISFIPGVLVNRLKLSYVEVSALGTVQSVCWLVGYLVWGRLQDGRGSVWTLRIIYSSLALVPASYILATAGWMLFPAYAVQGLAQAGIDIAFQSCIIDLAPSERVYEYAALHRTVIGIRGLIGPLIGSGLSQVGAPTQAIFALGLVQYLLAGGLMFHPVFTRKPMPPAQV